MYKKTIKDLKAYKLFVNNPNVLLYGKLNDKTNEVDYYHFDFDRTLLIYATKEINEKINTDYEFSIASVKTSDLVLSNDRPPYLPDDYVYDQSYVVSISIENLEANDEVEALNLFLEEIYAKQPFDVGYGYCHFFSKQPALTGISYPDIASWSEIKLIVTEKLPDYNSKTNINSYSHHPCKNLNDSSNLITTGAFDLICSEYGFNSQFNYKISLENFASTLGCITQAKLGNLLQNWNYNYQILLRNKEASEKAEKLLE